MDISTGSVPYALPPYLIALIERFAQAGEEVYLVGGSLRDLMLGLVPHDYDLATSAPPELTSSMFSDCRVIETGLKHGTVTVLFEGNPVEITTFRLDGVYADSRHPESVSFTRSIVEDLSRRDFTVNAMAYHPDVGLVDLFGGQDDLKRGVLRAVGDPYRRLAEDALRIMRAYRFSAQLGFALEEETERACIESKSKLTNIAVERIASEFLRLLTSQHPESALLAMRDGGVLSYVTGTYCPSERILRSLSQMPAEPAARLGFFFADIDEERAKTMVGHLKLSNQMKTGVGAVVRGSRLTLTSPADARRLIANCGIYAPAAVRASVLLGRSPAKALDWVCENRAPCTLSDLVIDGGDLLAAGFEGKEVGSILKALLESVLDDPERNQKEELLSIALGIKRKNLS
ncbi:MAG: polynucleotide adenylyltransferase [Clostridia bacterium]|nr:polynucleotide adenylyltransferase [Clostridia bacterium]